ncbi:MAG: GIY-YIG nuclease family protein, partial [Parcubacteria group bacterium]
MKKYYVYIVECADESYYTGITNNHKRRLDEHNSGKDEKSYTFTRRPVKLVHLEEFKYVLDAIAREKQLKGWSRAKKKALIDSRKQDLEFYSKRSTEQKHILR